MPRDNDKNNDSRGRRDRPLPAARAAPAPRGGRRRSSPSADLPARAEGRRRAASLCREVRRREIVWQEAICRVRGKPYAGKRDGDDRPPRRDFGDAPRPRGDRPFAAVRRAAAIAEQCSFKPREDRGGEKRPFKPRGDRPNFNRDDRPPRRDRKSDPGDRGDARPAGAFFRQEIWRQEALYPARRRRREAALHAARRRLSQGRRPAARRSALQCPAVARWRSPPWRSAGDENSAATRSSRAARPTAARARILATARSWCGSRQFKAVAEARRSRRA